jgi:hypothetical protein
MASVNQLGFLDFAADEPNTLFWVVRGMSCNVRAYHVNMHDSCPAIFETAVDTPSFAVYRSRRYKVCYVTAKLRPE